MKKNLTLSKSLTRAVLGIVLLNITPICAQELAQPTEQQTIKQRAQAQFKTLKEDWRCLREKGWKGCSTTQKSRIAAELAALTALIIGSGTAIYKGGKALQRRVGAGEAGEAGEEETRRAEAEKRRKEAGEEIKRVHEAWEKERAMPWEEDEE